MLPSLGLIALALVLTPLLLGAWLAFTRAYALVHPPRSGVIQTPEALGITNYQSVNFTSADGLTLSAWYMPTQNGAAVILVHGHGGERSYLLPEAAMLAQRGYGVLLMDLRNSGQSESAPTTFGVNEVNDVRGAIEFLHRQPGVDPDRLGLLGHSMGAGTVLLSAARLPQIKAVIAESGFTSLEDNVANGMRRYVNLPPFLADALIFFGERAAGIKISAVRPIDEIALINPRPVMIVHGALDDLVPVTNAYTLYAAAHEPKELYLIPNAGHYPLPPAEPEEYARRITGFFDKYLLLRESTLEKTTKVVTT